MPTPRKGEPHDTWISRCMGDEEQNKSFPDQKQRYAVCESLWREKDKKKSMNNDLTIFAEKLLLKPWLIKPATHTAMCKTLQGYLRNPVLLSQTDNVPNNYSTGTTETNTHAIINIQGILSKDVSEEAEQLFGLVDVNLISQILDMVANDPSVKDIILKFNSPGGETTGIEELGRKIVEIDKVKPVYCWTENQCDSAAFWLFTQGRVCGMSPSAQCAGVGVYMLVLNEVKKLEAEGIKIHPISAGKYKLLGHEFHDLTEEEISLLQEDINDQHNKFKQVILSRRPNISEEDLEGLSFNGEKAFKKNMVDILTDNIDGFISTIENHGDMYYNMKPEVTKTEVKTDIKVEAKTETPKVESVSTPEKKLSFIDKLKQLMGQYDGEYEAVPGVPGTEKENTPTNYTETDTTDNDSDEDKEDEEMDYKAEITRLKKALEEVQKKSKDTEDDVEDTTPPKMEGKYDGEYEKANATDNTPVVVAEKKEIDLTTINRMPTQEEFLTICGLGVATKPKGLSEWNKICAETFTGRVFDTKE